MWIDPREPLEKKETEPNVEKKILVDTEKQLATISTTDQIAKCWKKK